MQRTIYECDRCHKKCAEGDERRGLQLPPRWRQVLKDTTLTYELCNECGEAVDAFCKGHALVAGTVEPVKLSAAVLRLQQMHARIAPFSYQPRDLNSEPFQGTAATTAEHELATVLCEIIELLLEAVEQKDKPPATCMCGHTVDLHLPPEAFPSGCACKIPSCGCLSFISAEPKAEPRPLKAWPCQCGHGKDKHARTAFQHPCSECECFQFEPAVPNG